MMSLTRCILDLLVIVFRFILDYDDKSRNVVGANPSFTVMSSIDGSYEVDYVSFRIMVRICL